MLSRCPTLSSLFVYPSVTLSVGLSVSLCTYLSHFPVFLFTSLTFLTVFLYFPGPLAIVFSYMSNCLYVYSTYMSPPFPVSCPCTSYHPGPYYSYQVQNTPLQCMSSFLPSTQAFIILSCSHMVLYNVQNCPHFTLPICNLNSHTSCELSPSVVCAYSKFQTLTPKVQIL